MEEKTEMGEEGVRLSYHILVVVSIIDFYLMLSNMKKERVTPPFYVLT